MEGSSLICLEFGILGFLLELLSGLLLVMRTQA